MSFSCVTGLQWGDEGKGKVVDILASEADVVVRFQGGNNAGHTIKHQDKTYKLSIIPSGILTKRTMCYIGSGVALDIEHFKNEAQALRDQGISITNRNLLISNNCTLILSIHKEIDRIFEESGSSKIGTTKKGMGFAYQDRIARRAPRLCDILDDDNLESFCNAMIKYYKPIFKSYGQEIITASQLKDELILARGVIAEHSIEPLNFARKYKNKNVLFEGAQGIMLDITHGTYPFVTSSSTMPAQCFLGSGFGLQALDRNIGLLKAYTTRVGNGILPTEDLGETGRELQEKGGEIGTVTGRSRRCGFLDLVAAKQACDLAGITEIALTKLDVLDTFKEIKICVAYRFNNKNHDYFPSDLSSQDKIEPVYVDIEPWDKPCVDISSYDELPENAKKFVQFVEDYLDVKVSIVSTGALKSSTIIR